MKRSSIITAIICILLPLIIGSLSGLANIGSLDTWYSALSKPSFNPPGYLFGPVWTVLYLLMGVSLYLIWKSPSGKLRCRALVIFGIQMLLNFAWSFLFFYFRQIELALFDITVLWLLIWFMIFIFYKIIKVAALIQIPYLLWVSFASILNTAIWMLNK
jgi:tryptophan-rich sensory protein